MKVLFTTLLALLCFIASADHLVVQRNGNLREEPNSESEIIEKVKTGDKLELLDTDQTDGYYFVKSALSGQSGWIYRTLVKRMPGDIDVIVPGDVNAVVDIRILDIGAGHAAIIKLPGDKYVIYDAGGIDIARKGLDSYAQIQEYIPAGSEIELMVLSHTDADHIIAAEHVIRNYPVKKLLWTGYEKSMASSSENPTATYNRLVTAIGERPQMENVNLKEQGTSIVTGETFSINAAKFTFLSGFGEPPGTWTGLSPSEKLNAVSIVMKLEFGGKSVLFTGDAVGRHLNDPEDVILASEDYLVTNAAAHLPSTILLAPHHGAKNGSSRTFVELVSPEYVIFPAGHKHHHPTTRTADIYLEFLTTDKIFRTDRGDDEGTGEWTFGRKAGCVDKPGDDAVHIQLMGNGTYRVYYMVEGNTCN
jgi:beta-lactamase superfamily II metal-dependent hydrolase